MFVGRMKQGKNATKSGKETERKETSNNKTKKQQICLVLHCGVCTEQRLWR